MSKPGPNRLSVENGTNLEAIARARYFAFAQRRTMPPRCNPYGILGITLSLGILFLGLTMTIIANWPGVTSISGNQLFVAGPILLGIGGVAFVVVIIVVFVLSQRQQALWETRVTNMALERTYVLLFFFNCLCFGFFDWCFIFFFYFVWILVFCRIIFLFFKHICGYHTAYTTVLFPAIWCRNFPPRIPNGPPPPRKTPKIQKAFNNASNWPPRWCVFPSQYL